MSDDFWRRLSLVFGWIALALVFGLLILLANVEVKDLDLWLHLGMGRHIVENGFHVPQVDVLSWTVAGRPWVNHEWLFQVLVYAIHQFFGFNGLIFMQVILVSLTALLVAMLGYVPKRQFFSVIGLYFVVLVYLSRFTIRPDLFSLFFLVVYVYTLAMWLDRRWSVYLIFVVQVVWSNMHGFFFFGPFVVALALGADWMKRHLPLPWEWKTVGRLTDDESRRLRWMLLVSVLACLFNPMGVAGAWYPIGIMFQLSGESKIFFNHIMELKRPITLDNLFSFDQNEHYRILILLSAAGFVFNRRKIDVGVFLFWLLFLLFSLAAIRNLAFFAIAAYLSFMSNVISVSLRDVAPIRIDDRKFEHIVGIFAKAFLMIVCIQMIVEASCEGYFDLKTYERKSMFWGVSQRSFPDRAGDFLVRHRVKGNFLNEFNSGAYLVGRTYPDIRVFIDGRTEVYGPKFFEYAQRLFVKQDITELAKALENETIEGVLINTVRGDPSEKVLRYFYEHPQWATVYLGHDGVIFLKKQGINQRVIEETAIDFSRWPVMPLDIYRLRGKRVVPYEHLHRARNLKALGLTDLAVAELKAALYVQPSFEYAWEVLGDIHAERKDYAEAFYCFRTALVYGSNQQLRLKLARAADRLGRYDVAIAQFEDELEAAPEDAEVMFLMAGTYARAGESDKAVFWAKRGHAIHGAKDTRDLVKIADALLTIGALSEARAVCALGLDKNEDRDRLYVKLGEIYQREGDLDAARQAWQTALEIAPANTQAREFLGLSVEDSDGPKSGD